MKSSIRHAWLASSAFMALLAMTGASFAQDQGSLDRRLTLIEHKLDNAALGEMANQIEALRQQVQDLHGENAQMQHQIQELKEQQRNIYSDIDSRLRELEQSTTNPPSSSSTPSSKTDKKVVEGEGVSSGNVASANVSPDESGDTTQKKNQASGGGNVATQSKLPIDSTGEQAAYEQAFNTLKEGRYAKSQQEFNKLLLHYPKGHYADNARYWLGESYYAGRQFDQAIEQFQKVLDNFPHSAKRPGAQLKIGFIQFEQGKLALARKTLGEVIQRYPNSTAASLAQQRLRLIDSSQQQ